MNIKRLLITLRVLVLKDHLDRVIDFLKAI
jgi:hypothetical protein